ncbi:MAG: hypothetical protein ACFHWX_07185 [Bacteroidota bacterium]
MDKMKRGLWIFKMALMVILFFAVVSGIVMYLWNWLMPDIFDLRVITFWEAAGILLLSKIIFGFGKKGGHHHGGPSWKNKWAHMSEEQKNQWKEKFKEKWCSAEPRVESEKGESERSR